MSGFEAVMKGIYPDTSRPFEVNMSRAGGLVVKFKTSICMVWLCRQMHNSLRVCIEVTCEILQRCLTKR